MQVFIFLYSYIVLNVNWTTSKIFWQTRLITSQVSKLIEEVFVDDELSMSFSNVHIFLYAFDWLGCASGRVFEKLNREIEHMDSKVDVCIFDNCTSKTVGSYWKRAQAYLAFQAVGLTNEESQKNGTFGLYFCVNC